MSERLMKKLMPDPRDAAPELYWKVYKVVGRPLRSLHRIGVHGAENLPETGAGGAIVAALHNGALDGVFIALAAASRGRAVRFVADQDICSAPIVGPIIRDAGCIPIASHKGKGTDTEQIRAALAEAASVIRGGGCVGVFPEGVIHPFFSTRHAFTFKTGIIRLAIETRAPIIPTWARGAAAIFPWLSPVTVRNRQVYAMLPLWTPMPVTVHFGPPFLVDPELTLASPNEQIKLEATRLQYEVDKLRNMYRRNR